MNLRHHIWGMPWWMAGYAAIFAIATPALPAHGMDDPEWASESEADSESESISVIADQAWKDTIEALDSIQGRIEDSSTSIGIVENSASWGCWIGSVCGGPCPGALGALFGALYGASRTQDPNSYVAIALGSIPGLFFAAISTVYLFAAGALVTAMQVQFQNAPEMQNMIYGTGIALSILALFTNLAGPITVYGIIFNRKWEARSERTAAINSTDAATTLSSSILHHDNSDRLVMNY